MVDKQSTFMALPQDITDPMQLRRFLDKLIQQVDISYGNRGNNAFVVPADVADRLKYLETTIAKLAEKSDNFSMIDGSRNYTKIVSYGGDVYFTPNSYQIPDIKFVESKYQPLQVSIVDLTKEGLTYSTLDGSRQYTGIVGYNAVMDFTSGSNEIVSVKYIEDTYSKLDGSSDYTGIVSYNAAETFTSGSNQIVSVKYTEDTYEPKFTKNTAFNKDFGTASGTVTEGGTTTDNPIQDAIANLTQTISDPPTQAEVKAIQDKVNDILGALRSADIISN